MKERSHLKWHTFWWDQAIHIQQPKALATHIKSNKKPIKANQAYQSVYKQMKAYQST